MVEQQRTQATGTQSVSGFDLKPRPSVQVVVQPAIQLDNLYKIIERVVGLTGCRTCGLAGVDLQIVAGDPAIEQFRGIEGVEGVVARTRG